MAERLIEKKSHDVFGHEITVHRTPPEKNTRDSEPSTAILVEGLTKNVSEDMLELFFESPKRSGGGEIVKIKMDQSKGCAVIWYRHESGVYILYSKIYI